MTCRELIEGLTILAKYTDDNDVIEFEDGEIVCGPVDIDESADTDDDEFGDPIYIDRRVNPKDRERLWDLGWFVALSREGWIHFS